MVSGLNQAISQNVFNKIIDDPSNSHPYQVIPVNDGYLIPETSTGYKLRLTFLDEFGELSSRKTLNIVDSCRQYFSKKKSIFKLQGNTYGIIGYLIDSAYRFSIYFGILDYNFDTISVHTYFNNSDKIYVSDAYFDTTTQQITILGSRSISGLDKSYLFNINANGDSLNYKLYNVSSGNIYLETLTPTSDGMLLSGIRQSVSNITDEWVILKVDTALQQKWYRFIYGMGYSNEINDLIATSDGHYVAVGGIGYCSDYTGSTTFSNARLIKFSADQTGLDIIKDTTYAEPWFLPDGSYDTPNTPPCAVDSLVSQGVFKTIKELPDGNFLAIMHYYKSDQIQRNGTKLYLLNSQFSVEEKHTYTSCYLTPNTTEELNHLQILEDGSLLLSGTKYNANGNYPCSPNVQESWIVKTDSDFCDGFGSCDTSLRYVFYNLPDSMYKGDTLMVEFSVEGGRENIEYGCFISVHPTGVYTSSEYWALVDTIISHQVYTFPLYYTTKDSIRINYDLLFVDNSLGGYYEPSFRIAPMVRFVEDNSSVEYIENEQFKLFPNPVKSEFFVTLNKFKNQETIKIFNIGGVLVKQEKIIKEKTVINIAGLPVGVYFVKLGEQTQKLIVE